MSLFILILNHLKFISISKLLILSLNSIDICGSEKNARPRYTLYMRAADIPGGEHQRNRLWILSLWDPTAIEERVTR